MSDSRQGLNKLFTLTDLLRQSVYSRLAGYQNLNDADRVGLTLVDLRTGETYNRR